MKLKLKKKYIGFIKNFYLLISMFFIKSNPTYAEDSYFNEIEIDNSTKLDASSSDLPTNPFEIVEKLRRVNSMNDATKPSVAIDDALKLFNEIEEKENL